MSVPEGAVLLTTREVAGVFRVDPMSVTRWGKQGRLLRAGTPGRDCRFFAAEVKALRDGADPKEARKLAEAARDQLAGGASP